LGKRRAAVRPDGLRLDVDGPIAGVVIRRTFRRDHFLVTVKVADGPPLEVAVRGETVPDVGDPVHVTVEPSAVVELPD
jgi:hypothetical protein